MRKDVRTGTAIGGILIAVIVVYAIVVSKNHTKDKKDQVALDPGKNSPTGTPAGGADAVTGGHEEHPDAINTFTLSHEPITGGGLAPIPSHTEEAGTPTPGSDSDAVTDEHAKRWVALTSGVQTLAHTSSDRDHMITADSVPTGGNTPRTGVISTVDHTQTDSPTPTGGDLIPASGTTPGAETHDQVNPPTARPTSQTHRVAAGETFSSIARVTYGDAKYFKDIVKANPKVDPSRLKPGMLIVLPEKPQDKHDAAPAAPAAPTAPTETRHHTTTTAIVAPAPIDSKTEYRVKASDSLYKISLKLYNSPNKVDAIYQLNKEQIGADPAKLKLGMVLKLPEVPTASASH